jgi:hypothetical protein
MKMPEPLPDRLLRYFVLKPKAQSKYDIYAKASRSAMRAYADAIEDENQTLALDLRVWAGREDVEQERMESSLDEDETSNA